MSKKEDGMKQCPFCLKDAVMLICDKQYYMACSNSECKTVKGPFASKREAIDSWNQRGWKASEEGDE